MVWWWWVAPALVGLIGLVLLFRGLGALFRGRFFGGLLGGVGGAGFIAAAMIAALLGLDVQTYSRLTLGANALSGVLVLVLAGIMVWLVRRYIGEIETARDTLDRMNAGLEGEVRDRTSQLTLARDRAEAMLREVNHRVGNSLQLVSSFMSMQLRHLADEGARAALKESQARIEAVAHVHRRLYTSDDMSSVAMDEYLEGLIAELAKSVAPGAGSPTLTLKARPVAVSTDQAVSIGVIVTELVTNAVKYAYGPGQGGEIRIILEPDPGNGRALLTVEDDGPGLGDAKPKGTGLGGKIVTAMASGLRSKIEYDPAHPGVRALLAFDLQPLSR